MLLATLPLAASAWINNAVEDGGYIGVGVLLLVEGVFPPIPSEAVLPLAGYFVDNGTLKFFPTLIAATIGVVVSALLLYAIGRYGGRPVLDRYGRYLGLDQKTLDRADVWFDRHGTWIVLFGRLIPGVRSVVSVPAGWAEMPVWRFLLLTTIGTLMWNSLLIGAGMALGSNWERVEGVIGPVGRVVAVLFVLAMVAVIVWLWRRRGRQQTA